jgi:phage terminase large subunit GpA-like protein
VKGWGRPWGLAGIWTDADRHDAVSRGKWSATNPEGASGVAGFHISVLMSPWVALSDIVQEFLAARRDPALLQVFVNTALGEPFDIERERIGSSTLLSRGETYSLHSIPQEVRFLTAGVDVQGDRLEAQIIGWGPFEESWAVRYEVLPGDPAQQHAWDQLDEVLRDTYHAEDGRELRVKLACVDTGGHHQHQVLTY